jgi:hypothetical protein
LESESEYSVSEPASNWYGEPPRDGETERGETDAERGETGGEPELCSSDSVSESGVSVRPS